nr:ribonuclease H-like domain-containing protein [Tanacetum cinerariifolium]
MRIEQYFLMTDYSLWEVILNSDSPIPTRVIEGVVQSDALTTAEQRLARNNELKASGTLLMALLDKPQLKFNIQKDTKTLMEAIDKRFVGNKETKKTDLEDQSLDDLFNSLKIYKAEVKSSSSASTSTQNIAFVPSQNTNSTNEPVHAVASVSAASAKIPVFALLNVDTLSNAVIYSFFASQSNSLQLDNDDLKQEDVDDLEEMDLKWQMAMLTVRAKRFLQRTGRNLSADGPTSMGFDMSKAEEEPTNYALMAFTSSSSSSFDNEKISIFDVISYKTGLESVEARILVYQQNETIFEEDIKLLKLDIQHKDNALVVFRQKFKKAKQERDELKLKLEKFQTSSKNLSQLLASQTNDKTRLGYDNHVFTSSMFNYDEMFSFESDISMPTSTIYDRYQLREGYHVVPPPYTGTFMPPKPDLVFHDPPNVSNSEDESKADPSQNDPSFLQPTKQVKPPRPFVKPIEHYILAANPKTDNQKPKTHKNSRNRKACFVCKSVTHLIKDLLTKSKLVLLTAARPVITTVSQPHVTRPRPARTVVTKPHSQPRSNISRRPSPKPSNFPPKVTTVKAPIFNVVKGVQGNWGNPQHALKDKGVVDSGCSRHMIGNMSYLYDFKEINGGYVAFGRNPKGGKINGKGKIRTGKLDFDDVYFFKELKFNLFSVSHMCDKKNNVLFIDTELLLRVPRENNMYNVDLKNIVPFRDLTCLFAKATLDEFNIWHKRLGHINFKTMNKLVKGNLVRGLPLKVFENNHTCVACKKGKQHRASCKTKPAEAVNTACYVQNRVLVTKPHNKTLYELLLGKTPSIGFVRPFGCPVTIPSTLDPLGKFDGKADEGFLVGYSNTNDDASFKVKEPEFEGRKPKSKVHVSPSSSAKTKKHDDKTKREAKGKSLVDAVGSSNTDVSPTHGKSSYVDPFQYPNDTNMPALEDITYFDDEKDVGAEADFINLETTITKEGIDYKEVFAPVARIEAIRLFLAYASFMGFMVYQMDVKSAFLYGTIEEERGNIDQALFIKNQKDGKSASTPIDTEKPLLKDPDDCLPNEEIFIELSRMGYEKPSTKLTFYKEFFSAQWNFLIHTILQCMSAKRTSWNEFSSSMALAVICLSIVVAGVDVDDVPAADAEPTLLSPIPTTQPPPPQELPSTLQGRPEESQAQIYKIDLEHADKVLSMQDDESEPAMLIEVVEIVTTTKLMTKVVTDAAATITAATTPINVATITAAPSAARSRKGVVIRELEETTTPSIIIHSEPKSIDKGKGIMVQRKEKEDNAVLRYQALKRKPQTEAQARKNMMFYLRNMAGFKMKYFKGMCYNDICPIFEKALKKTSKSLEEKAAKKQKLDEEVEKLKKHLQIVPNDDDDVYTEAIPHALKVLVVDNKIYTENNKPYYKIIRADGTHQVFLRFLSLLRNFDREDLEVLWQLVRERFASLKPKNFSDDFFLTTLTYMSEKPNVEAQVWKN